jgi:SecD/SecF fusion protein
MNGKRFIAFLLVVLITFGIIGATTPWLVKNVRLGLDLRGGFEILYVAQPIEAGQKVTKDLLNRTAESVAQRANKSGVAEPDVTTEGTDRIRVRLAGVANQEELRKTLQEPASLTFRSGSPDFKTVELVGSDFVEGGASVGFDSQTNRPIVQIKLKDAKKFADITKRLSGQPLAIYLDDKQLSAPIVNGEISGGVATITGNYTLQEANSLRDTINLGALPLKLTEKYTQSVGASLGQQSLKETGIASAIASVLILLFMLFWYRVPGIVASIALITFTWLLLAVTVLMHATLTLPGIAAFVLSVGIAVDSNIIMAERIKDEMRSGKSILSSLKSGSKHSFRTIIDAHVTTALAGIVLYIIGTGSIKGFALTLLLSIVLNILTNVFYSRWLLHMLVRSDLAKKPGHYGVKESEIHAL